MPIHNRRLYVNGFDTILNSTTSQNNLIAWCIAKSIDTLQLYGLTTIFASSSLKTKLKDFLIQIRSNTNIQNILGARGYHPLPLATAPDFGYADMNTYNHAQTDRKARIGGWNAKSGLITEYEWYNSQYTDAEKITRFQNMILLMESNTAWRADFAENFPQTPEYAPAREVYIGQFKPTAYAAFQADKIVRNTTRCAVSAYVDCSDATKFNQNYPVMFNYIKSRLSYLGQAQAAAFGASTRYTWYPIFSYEPTYMEYVASASGKNKTFDTIFNDLLNQFTASSFVGKANLYYPAEYAIFAYSHAFAARPSLTSP